MSIYLLVNIIIRRERIHIHDIREEGMICRNAKNSPLRPDMDIAI